jgi:hypothetical protein
VASIADDALDRPEPQRLEDAPQFDFALVSDDFFRTLRIPLLEGRTFSPSDGPDSPPVAIVNETARRRLWPGADPIDRMIQIGVPEGLSDEATSGIQAHASSCDRRGRDIKTATLEEATGLQLYVNLAQAPVLPGRQLFGPVNLIVRSDVRSCPSPRPCGREVLALDKDQPVSTGSALSDLIHQSLARGA